MKWFAFVVLFAIQVASTYACFNTVGASFDGSTADGSKISITVGDNHALVMTIDETTYFLRAILADSTRLRFFELGSYCFPILYVLFFPSYFPDLRTMQATTTTLLINFTSMMLRTDVVKTKSATTLCTPKTTATMW